MILFMLNFFGNYLIELMSALAVVALALRWISFNHSKTDEGYFSQFTRELAATIDEDKVRGVEFEDVEGYLSNMLGRVNQKLPDRNIRYQIRGRRKSDRERKEAVSLNDYVGSKHGLIASIQNESSVFNSRVPPNFGQLTERILNDDKNWSKVFGFFPVDGVTRILDVLPNIFIVLGVFGTFVGISMALPEIAKINFSNLETSGEILSKFVSNVAFSMNTSIVGIIYSLGLTLLNTLFPVDASRHGTFEKVESVIETLWFHLQTDQHKHNAEKILPKLLLTLEKILQTIETSKGPDEKMKKAG
ncbi:MAG: hypothetical protein AABY86_01380 [Bdellovibrionota bacterium]